MNKLKKHDVFPYCDLDTCLFWSRCGVRASKSMKAFAKVKGQELAIDNTRTCYKPTTGDDDVSND